MVKNMQYIINEGYLNLPLEGRIDRTLNVLATPDGSGNTYLISRDELRPGESLRQFVERQLNELSGQVKGYQSTLKPTLTKIIVGFDEAIEFAGAFTQNGQEIHQRQVALKLPGTQRVLILTLSGFEPFSEAALRNWAATISSFKLRPMD